MTGSGAAAKLDIFRRFSVNYLSGSAGRGAQARVGLTNHSSASACQPSRVLRLCGQSEKRNHNHARQLQQRSNGVERTMSGDRRETNQNAEVIPDAGDAAIHTAQPRRAADHVFAPFIERAGI